MLEWKKLSSLKLNIELGICNATHIKKSDNSYASQERIRNDLSYRGVIQCQVSNSIQHLGDLAVASKYFGLVEHPPNESYTDNKVQFSNKRESSSSVFFQFARKCPSRNLLLARERKKCERTSRNFSRRTKERAIFSWLHSSGLTAAYAALYFCARRGEALPKGINYAFYLARRHEAKANEEGREQHGEKETEKGDPRARARARRIFPHRITTRLHCRILRGKDHIAFVRQHPCHLTPRELSRALAL